MHTQDIRPSGPNPVHADEVPNGPIRDAVQAAIQRGELQGYGELAVRMGAKSSSEASRVQRSLGVMKAHGGRKADGGAYPPRMQTTMLYEQAVAIVRALGRSPVEFDL